MPDSTHESERIIGEARRSLSAQRAGGRRGGSIGAGSARLKAQDWTQRLKRMVIALALIIVGAMGVGLFVGALGFEGLMITVLLAIIAIVVLAKFPRIDVPTPENLARGDLRQTIARTELWLESQRPALPAPAVPLLDHIGGQLDGLGVQLTGLDENTPAAAHVRTLVADHLPEIIASYTAIPSHLRDEPRAGSTPDAQLADGLKRISGEIDDVTRKLAEGALDELAVRSRYLDYRYGGPDVALKDGTASRERLTAPEKD